MSLHQKQWAFIMRGYAYGKGVGMTNEEIIERLRGLAGLKCSYAVSLGVGSQSRTGVLLGYTRYDGRVFARLSAQLPPKRSPGAGDGAWELVPGANDYNCYSQVDPATVVPLETTPSWHPEEYLGSWSPTAGADEVVRAAAPASSCHCGWPHGPCAAHSVDDTP